MGNHDQGEEIESPLVKDNDPVVVLAEKAVEPDE